MKDYIIAALTILTLAQCAPEPRDISYGLELCSHCKMTIVDQQHAAQLVTDKGKIYSFDAIECMVGYEQDNPNQYAFRLVNHLGDPATLHPAEGSTFLISKQLPSPMGAFLNALPDLISATQLQNTHGGHLYNWADLTIEVDQYSQRKK